MAAAILAACLAFPAPHAARAQEQPAGAADSLATESLPLEPTREVRFRTEEGSWMSVDVSPDGRTLVFDLLGDLYTLPIEGGTAAPLLTGPAFESQPRFSPDGTEIVFVSDRSGGQNLWVLSADGSDTTQITRGNDNLYTSPEWSPDGDYLVASRTFSPLGGAAKPWLFHRDGGSGIALIDEPEQLKAIGPAFDPSGRYIYLAQGTRDWTYDAALPQVPAHSLRPRDRAAGDRDGPLRVGVPPGRVARRRHAGVRFPGTRTPPGCAPVTSPPATSAGWSSRCSATTWRAARPSTCFRATPSCPTARRSWPRMAGGSGGCRLDGSEPAAIPLRGRCGGPRGAAPGLRLPGRGHAPPSSCARSATWRSRPTAGEVAFTALGDLYVMDADGGEPRRVGAGIEGALSHPAWSPDGETLAAVSWLEPGGGRLWAVSADDGDARQLSQASRYLQSPAWSPDGDRIVVLQSPVRSRLPGAGGGSQTDIVWYGSAAAGAPTVVAEALGRSRPHFRTDQSDRIYLHAGARGLVSVRWDGTDEREHLKVTGFSANRGGPPANASSIRMSPPEAARWPGSATTSTW